MKVYIFNRCSDSLTEKAVLSKVFPSGDIFRVAKSLISKYAPENESVCFFLVVIDSGNFVSWRKVYILKVLFGKFMKQPEIIQTNVFLFAYRRYDSNSLS